MIRGAKWLRVVDWTKIQDASLLSLLRMGVLNWKAPNNRLHQATQAIRHGTAVTLRLLPVIVMTFWYGFRNGLTFFELFSLGIDHDPPCFLCSHDLCLFSFLMFHSSHDYMAK